MEERLYRWFHLRQGELGLVLILGIILFSNYAAMGITKVIAVSGFLSEVKGHYILLVWAIDMVLLILASGLQSLIIDRFSRVNLTITVLIIFSVLYAGLPILFQIPFIPRQINYALIYLLNDQQWRFFPVLFWILVNDLFSPSQGQRLQPTIANFAFVGTIVGLGVAALESRMHVGPTPLLLLNATIFLLAGLVGYGGLRSVKLRKVTITPKPLLKVFTEGWSFVREVPAFAYLSASMLATGIVMTILLYDTLTDAQLVMGINFQGFYASYNLAIALGSILVQSQAQWLINRLQLKNTFMVQTLTMLAGSVLSLVFPVMASSALAQGVARTNYDTVDVSARKAFQAFVPDERRGRVSMFIDSYLPSLGTIIGSLVTFAIVLIGLNLGQSRIWYSSIYLGVAIAVALISLGAGFRMRKVYDASLLNWRLKRRRRGVGIISQIFDNNE